MRKIFGCLIFLLVVAGAKAQVLPDSVIVADSLEIADAESELLSKEDSVEINYYSLPTNWEYVPGDDDPLVIADRLSCIEKTIPLRYNEKIHGFINYFTVKDRAYTRMIIQRMNLYFPLFEKYLAEYNLPDELKYLAIIESGLNPRAISRARAVGLWQFMSATGRYFGLHIDWYIDERMDPEKSTRAACQYLKQLYGMFGDWELALAAYNSGPGNVKRAIRKAGYKKSFWDIYPYVPRETRSYVPQFIAITYTMNYLSEHNFIMDEQEAFPLSDTLRIKKYLHLPTLAKLTETCMDDIIKLNPSIQHNALPDLSKPYTLHLPTYTLKALNNNRTAILDSASVVGKKDLELLARNASGSTYGDVLGSIAIRHNVKVADLKKWNNLSSNTIRTGQRLNIWLKPSAFAAVSATVAQANISNQPLPDSKTYTVQPGDTLWSISQKFQGLTIDKIKSLNKLTGSKIQPGQKLVIGI
ncbi:MAG: LysM peptidoglycan-binding domain-containing protein [Cytophagia bacterium]|nr:LysM peptidoglycan-binding domain-containing protein [Cytophagia bacterium]